MLRRVALIVGLWGALGCSGVDAALRDRTSALLEDYRRRRPPEVAVTPRASSGWADGQYVVFSVQRAGRVGLVRYAVDARDAGGLWLTVEALSYEQQRRWRVLFAREPRARGELVSLARRAVIATRGAAARTVDFEADASPEVAQLREALAPVWAGALASPPDPDVTRDVTTPAGRFTGAAPTRAQVLTVDEVSDCSAWRHPAVPLSGLVAGGAADGAAAFELVEFGDDGGAPLF